MTVHNLAQTAAMNFMAAHAGGSAASAVDVNDDGRWMQGAGCATKAITKEAMADLKEKGIPPSVLRVRRLPVE